MYFTAKDRVVLIRLMDMSDMIIIYPAYIHVSSQKEGRKRWVFTSLSTA